MLEDVAPAQAIDDALVHGANHPEGPLAWARRMGHERVCNVLNNIAEETGDAIYRPSLYFSGREEPARPAGETSESAALPGPPALKRRGERRPGAMP